MAALRSSLRMLSRGSSVSSAAAYTRGTGMKLNRAAQPLPAVAPPAAIRNFEKTVWEFPHTEIIFIQGCQRFSTGFGESADKAGSGKRTWWQRVKYRMENVDSEERARIFFAYSVFVMGTPTALLIRGFFRG